MDELTRERYPFPLPLRERRYKWTYADVVAHRITLCGTADLTVLEPGGDQTNRRGRERRLIEAMRRYSA